MKGCRRGCAAADAISDHRDDALLRALAGIKILNTKIRDAANAARNRHPSLNLKIVESYDLFEKAAGIQGGDACKAGLTMLMTKGPKLGECDLHASVAGEKILASAVWEALTPTEQQALLASVE